MLSFWFIQMYHVTPNNGYRPTFTFLSTDFGPSDNRLFVLSCSYWSQSYSSGAIRSKEQWITYLGHTFYLNLIILSFFPKYAEWHFDRTYFFHSGLKRETPGRGHSRCIANGCHPLKIEAQILLYENEIWHATSLLCRYVPNNFWNLGPYCKLTFSTNIERVHECFLGDPVFPFVLPTLSTIYRVSQKKTIHFIKYQEGNVKLISSLDFWIWNLYMLCY